MAECANFKARDLDLDLGSGHTAYLHESLIDLYLHTKFHRNRRNFLWTDGRTNVRTGEHLRPTMQLAINRVIIKLFGTMSQNYYQEVSNYFGINTIKELIHNRFQKFRISYGAADNYLCRLIFAKCWTYFNCTVYIFLFFSWLPFFDGEI